VGRDEPVERGAVRASLGDALERALRGDGSVVVLTGEPGIGKTTLARDVADRARRGGATVRWAACWAGGATVAHGPWLTVLAGLGGAGEAATSALTATAANAPGPDDAAAATSARASAYASVATALGDAAAARPLVVVLDDLHWADAGTIQLLGVVAGHVPASAVLVVATYRDTEVLPGAPLTRLTSSADRLALGGLDVDGVAALLRVPLGDERAGRVAAEVHRRTGGNPFLVVQLGRLLASDDAALEHRALPTGARDLLDGRLALLSDADRAVLVAAAVLGHAFSMQELVATSGASPDEIAAALDRAASARIVERSPGVASWSFVHDLFREATFESVDHAHRAALHRRAADALVATGAEPAAVAHHLLSAGDVTVEAAAWSVKAGHRATAAFAWEEAVAHYERALAALAPADDDHVRADALLGLGRARLLVGDDAAAGRAFEHAAALARRTGEPQLLARAALGFSTDLSGFEVRLFDQRQIDLLEEAAAALDGAELGALRATVLARLSVALSLVVSGHRRLALAEEAVRLARSADDRVVLGRCLAAHCDAIASPDHVHERLAETAEIIAIGEQAGDASLELLGRRLRLVALLELGEFVAADDEAAAFGRRAAAVGNPLYSWYVPLWAGQRALLHGDLDAADAAISDARSIGRAAGSTNAEMLSVVLELGRAWAAGDYAGAVDGMHRLARENPDLAMYLSSAGGNARAYVLAGRPGAAAAILDRCHAVGVDALPFDAEWLPNVVTLLDAAVALGHPMIDELIAACRPYTDLVAFEGIGAGLYGSVARFVALGCAARGDHDEAVVLARAALETNQRAGGLLAADALRTLADCLDRRADPTNRDEAAELHERADAAYRAAGARHHVRARPTDEPPATSAALGNELRRDGDVWHVRYAGTTTIVKHGKGVADLAVLLAAPGREVHVSELESVPRDALGSSAGAALDRRAVAEYKARLAELTEELDDAELAHDVGRIERARTEHDALVRELTRSLGLGGRSRAAGSEPVERLRKAVSARIRDAIRRIEAVHPQLGRHLSHAVRTGVFCSYQPESPVAWHCQT
jgi:tetratricopeptide (TPR) repeat protein